MVTQVVIHSELINSNNLCIIFIGTYYPCDPENVKCGKLLCSVPSNVYPIMEGSYTISYNFYDNAICTSVSYVIGDIPDPGLVLDGTKCSNNSVCFEGVRSYQFL